MPQAAFHNFFSLFQQVIIQGQAKTKGSLCPLHSRECDGMLDQFPKTTSVKRNQNNQSKIEPWGTPQISDNDEN